MNTIVVDSSVIVKWLNQTNEVNIAKADEILQSAFEGSVELVAPELARYEIGNVLMKKRLTIPEAVISLSTVYSLPISFIPESEELANETYNIAFNSGITYYDASFMSLAKLYDATLVTENLKHQGKSKDIKVKHLKDY